MGVCRPVCKPKKEGASQCPLNPLHRAMTSDFTMPFAGISLDFAETQRSAKEVQSFVEDPKAQCLCFYKGRAALEEGKRLLRIHPSKLIGQNLHDPGPLFLGLEAGIPLFAVSLVQAESIAHEESFETLRALGPRLSPQELALAGRARAILEWHFTHRFCPKCGTLSTPNGGGVQRLCMNCKTEDHPRVNPVVIMLILSGDKVLLGRGPDWPEGWMSALAGFVSPGETIEEAVSREAYEEVGIHVRNTQYIFSQPWPFPSQLMMGAICEAENETITLNKAELDDARWYSKDEVKAVMDGSSEVFRCPPPISIAYQLLSHWMGQ